MLNLTHIDKQAETTSLLEVKDLWCSYVTAKGLRIWGGQKPRNVIQDVSFLVEESKTFALVGESGSGKTTIMRTIAGLLIPTGGNITFAGKDITEPIEKRSKELHHLIQIVFQNPDSSLNPRRPISYAIGRSFEHFLGLSGKQLRERVEQALIAVNLDPIYARRYPPQLSKGERQRVAIARALAAEPSLLLCDEILSSLDVSVQASIIDLLIALQQEQRLTYFFISHDLAVVRSLAHHVGVLYLGRLCEVGSTEEVFNPPYHPYTEVLLMAVPRTVKGKRPGDIVIAAGELGQAKPEKGCFFAPRCTRKLGTVCEQDKPPWQITESGHGLSCHIPREKLLELQKSFQH